MQVGAPLHEQKPKTRAGNPVGHITVDPGETLKKARHVRRVDADALILDLDLGSVPVDAKPAAARLGVPRLRHKKLLRDED